MLCKCFVCVDVDFHTRHQLLRYEQEAAACTGVSCFTVDSLLIYYLLLQEMMGDAVDDVLAGEEDEDEEEEVVKQVRESA